MDVLFEGGVFSDGWRLIMTPIHELGHIVMATICFVPSMWIKWDRVLTACWAPGQAFMIGLAGYLAETGVFVAIGYRLRKTPFWWIVCPYIGLVAYTRTWNGDMVPGSEWLMWIVWYASDIVAIGLIGYWRLKWLVKQRKSKNQGMNELAARKQDGLLTCSHGLKGHPKKGK